MRNIVPSSLEIIMKSLYWSICYINLSEKFVLSKANAEDDVYIDQKNKLKVTVNHLEQEIIAAETTELTLDPRVLTLR